MDDNLIPTTKEKNLFWSAVMTNALVSLFGAFFVGSFFYLATKYLDYGFYLHLFIFLDTGLFLLIIFFYGRNKIIPIKH